MKNQKIAFVVIVFILSFWGLRKSGSAAVEDWRSKVDPVILATSENSQPVEFIVVMQAQADLSPAALLATKGKKGQFVFDELTAVADQSQASIQNYLASKNVPYQSFWITNMLLVEGDTAVIQAIAQRSDVARLVSNPALKFDEPTAQIVDEGSHAVTTVEWGVAKINADDVWALGYTGQGVVVAGQDTGYMWDHAALKMSYQGWNGLTADHNYNWHDAIHEIDSHNSGSNPCGLNLTVPCDDHGHGTHTMGTISGDDGGTNQIGVAPGAEWIACRNMERGWGTPTTYAECLQWFIAPTDLNNTNPDPSKAPHVINNSWSCPADEGCTDPAILQTAVENVRAAGIFMAVSAGNSGSSCSTINTPAAIYDASYSIGATSSNDAIASFSSRGPVLVDGSGRFKPDVSAPGVSVRSSTYDGGYGLKSGTSMASPHVAGAVALLISADPTLAGQVDKIEQILRNTAVPLTSTQTCGGISGSQSPNHTFGYGRIDVLAAVNHILSPPDAVAPVVDIMLDESNLMLNWDYDRANCQFAVYRSDNLPYFTPAPALHLATMWADTNLFVDDSAPLPVGDPAVNANYQVQANNCGVDTAVSNTVGEFDFALITP